MITGITIDDWITSQGDSQLRLNYNLNKDSLVIDAGAYYGLWFNQIYQKYKCKIIAYEPALIRYNACLSLENQDVQVKKLGLFSKSIKAKISDEGDASSIFCDNGEEIDLVDIAEELKLWGNVDLIKINVEGSEYEILERLIELNALNMFKNIQVQFHKNIFLTSAQKRREFIRHFLGKTHHLTYDFEFIWENWEINSTSIP